MLIPYPLQSIGMYLNWASFPFFVDWSKGGERFGFRAGTVESFIIRTTDGLSLGAWHIKPKSRCSGPFPGIQSGVKTVGAQKLKDADRVFLYFHGNAGNVATFHRTSFYKMMSGLAGNNHVIAVDYRGFGNSSWAFPTEKTVRIDARSSYDWILDQGVKPSNIFICGHSLGSGVATDLVHSICKDLKSSPCGGLIIISGYASIGDAAIGYPMIPLLRPFHGSPMLESWLKKYIQDKWWSHRKIREIKVPILILHGKKDIEIQPWQAKALFYEAVGGRMNINFFSSSEGFWELREKNNFNHTCDAIVKTVLPGEEGELLSFDETIPIWLLEAKHGGHNTMSIHQVVDDTISNWLESLNRKS
jgi:abhydrolase domain-containing protein 12